MIAKSACIVLIVQTYRDVDAARRLVRSSKCLSWPPDGDADFSLRLVHFIEHTVHYSTTSELLYALLVRNLDAPTVRS